MDGRSWWMDVMFGLGKEGRRQCKSWKGKGQWDLMKSGLVPDSICGQSVIVGLNSK